MELAKLQHRLDAANDAFHQNLHLLLHRQGMFHILQQHLPNNIQEFMDNHNELMHMHTVFAESHKEVIAANIALTLATFPKQDIHLSSPPTLIRQQSTLYTTPKKPQASRKLFPDFTDEE